MHFLANDDIATPTALVGKKVAPIYQMVSDNLVMGESLDIIAKVDTDEKYGIYSILFSFLSVYRFWRFFVKNVERYRISLCSFNSDIK